VVEAFTPLRELGFGQETYYIETVLYSVFTASVKVSRATLMQGLHAGARVRAVVQRVLEASVAVSGETIGKIGQGVLVFLGVGTDDTDEDGHSLADKVVNLRIFPDAHNKMNLSVLDVQGAIMVISQFTLFGDCRKGRRPSYIAAAQPEQANTLYETFIDALLQHTPAVVTGRFQEHMQVSLINDGPVTLLIDSRKSF
jgi:D-aminoacyl-tRNA deacylase